MGIVSFVPMGRMGNFYFEAMTCYSYCKKYDLDFSAPAVTSSDVWSPLYAKHLIRPDYPIPFHADIHIRETQHCYSEIGFDESWRGCNILFEGYFQSEKYFIDYREDILKDFKFEWELKEGWTSIHLRLTDYKIHADRHHNISDQYLFDAIDFFTYKGFNKFLVFSDGMPEAKERLNSTRYPNAIFEYSEGRNEETDLYLGSCCQHNIIAASTFSWFQAWLGRNEDKIVIAPKKWFEKMNAHLDSNDIVPERWIRM